MPGSACSTSSWWLTLTGSHGPRTCGERGEVLGAFQKAGVQIAVSSSGQVLDLRSSMGDLMSSLGAFFAAEENRKRRDRNLSREGRSDSERTQASRPYTVRVPLRLKDGRVERRSGARSRGRRDFHPSGSGAHLRIHCSGPARAWSASGSSEHRGESLPRSVVPGARPSDRPGAHIPWDLGRRSSARAVRLRSKDCERGPLSASRCCAPSCGPTWATSQSAHVPASGDGNLRGLRSAIGCASTGNWSTAQGNRATLLLRVLAATACASRSREDLHPSDDPLGQARRLVLGRNRGGSHSGRTPSRRPSASVLANQSRSQTGRQMSLDLRPNSSASVEPKRFSLRGSVVVL